MGYLGGCSAVEEGQGFLLILLGFQGYQWLKEKVQSEDGKKQQARVMDLLPIAHQLGCTVAQLAIGETLRVPCCSVRLPTPLSRLVCPWKGPSSDTLGVSV